MKPLLTRSLCLRNITHSSSSSCRNIGPSRLNRSIATSNVTPIDLEYDRYVSPDVNEGDGPLVILHGLLGSKRNWQSLAKAFQKDLKRPIYSLDLRNQGMSPHAEPMTYTAMATDVLHFCQKFSLSNISLLGHSMGGKVAMSFALHPDLPHGILSNLIVADITPSKGGIGPEFQGYVKGMQKIEASKLSSRKEAQDILSEYEQDPSVRAFLLTNLSLPTEATPYVHFRIPLSILGDAISEIGNFPYEPGHRSWEGRTLFVKGTKSKFINKKNIPLAKEYFPNMIMEELDAGHWVHAEKPNEFRKLVTDFVGQPTS